MERPSKRTSVTDPAWKEYDMLAEHCAKHGIAGPCWSRMPENISGRVVALIEEDPEAFCSRIREFAYGFCDTNGATA